MQNSNSVRLGGTNGVYLEVLVDGKPTDFLLDTGNEITLIPGHLAREFRKRPVISLIPAANGTLIELLGLVEFPMLLQEK